MNPGVVGSAAVNACTTLVDRLHSRIQVYGLLVSRIRRIVFMRVSWFLALFTVCLYSRLNDIMYIVIMTDMIIDCLYGAYEHC